MNGRRRVGRCKLGSVDASGWHASWVLARRDAVLRSVFLEMLFLLPLSWCKQDNDL